MFQTKKKLLNKISELEDELSNLRAINARSALIDKANLPPCLSLACVGCEKAIFQKYSGGIALIGCGKDNPCHEFVSIRQTIPDTEIEWSTVPQGLQ